MSGTTSCGFLKIYSDYKFKLSLDAANITNLSNIAVNIQSGKRCFVVMSGASVLIGAEDHNDILLTVMSSS